MQLVPHAPQFFGSFDRFAHALPQSMSPEGHEVPQDVPSQVAVPPVGAGHAVHDVPHDDVDVLLSHVEPQRCVPVGHAQWPPWQVSPPEQT
jgi:hypothetical protein